MKLLSKIRFLPITIFFAAMMLTIKVSHIWDGIEELRTPTFVVAGAIAQTGAGAQEDPRPDEKPEAPNAIAILGSGEPVVMLHAHIDTVPIAANEAENWTVEPYAGIVKDGKIYGKGSIDDKAPLASMMLAMEYAFSDRVQALVGYRYLELDFRDNGYLLDISASGFALGLALHF